MNDDHWSPTKELTVRHREWDGPTAEWYCGDCEKTWGTSPEAHARDCLVGLAFRGIAARVEEDDENKKLKAALDTIRRSSLPLWARMLANDALVGSGERAETLGRLRGTLDAALTEEDDNE